MAVIIVLGVAFITLGPIEWGIGGQMANEEERKMTGELLPFEIDTQQPIEIQCGGFHVILGLDELQRGFDLSNYFKFGTFDYPFRVTLKDQRFLISVDVENSKGQTVTSVVENEWSVNNDPVIAHDRNYNSYAFEVIDSNLVPVIQVVLKPGNYMYIGGFFYSPNGTVLLTGDTMRINPTVMNANSSLPRIFKYPSSDYLGQMVVKSTYQVPRTSAQVILLGEVLTVSGIFLNSYTIYVGVAGYVKEKRRRKRKASKQASRKVVTSTR